MKRAGSMLVIICSVLLVTNVVEAKKPKPKYKILWESSDNRVVSNSVCHNYPKGSIAKRGCRKQAKQLFKSRCNHYRNKVRTTNYPYSKKYVGKRDLFCIAASQFNPL